MPAAAEKSRVTRFGLFEVDLQEAELRKSGIRIKLQDQPFQILTMLLERPGETVTREELRSKLWPADTFVDFDHSLNSSIKKLREALGDDSDNPRFIETLHRRGYRFIAPVQDCKPCLPIHPPPMESRSKWKPLAYPGRWNLIALALVISAVLAVWLRWPVPPPRVVRTQQLTSDGVPKEALVTDGHRIYFTEYPPGRAVVAQVSSGGGDTATMDLQVPHPIVRDLSRDESELLLQAMDGSCWSVSLPAGSPRRLGDLSAQCALWRPDGKLLFSKGENVASILEPAEKDDLYIAEHDGSKPGQFATAPGSASGFSFSPDGTRFRVTLTNPANWTSAIWEAGADGSDMHPLLPGWSSPPSECCGHWTPDGKYYIFQSTRGGTTNIWARREHSRWWKNGSREPIQLTVGPLQLSGPVPSADGKRLFAIGTHSKAELVRYDAKSGEFVPYLGGMSAGDLDFSRDGQWITYVSYPDYTLWRSRADGSERLQLTYPPLITALAHWSPDGQYIAFSGLLPGKAWKVFLVSKNGGTPQQLISDELQELDPTWSADGKTLAFGRSAWKNDESSRIAVLNVASHQISELPDSQRICCPRWSPDGRYIVAVTTGQQDRLMLFDFKTQTWRELHTGLQPFAFGYMVWSRDSTYIYFNLSLSREARYFRIRVSDSKLERPLDLKGLRQFPDLFGTYESWAGLDPGDTPLFVRDISTQEIYALELELP